LFKSLRNSKSKSFLCFCCLSLFLLRPRTNGISRFLIKNLSNFPISPYLTSSEGISLSYSFSSFFYDDLSPSLSQSDNSSICRLLSFLNLLGFCSVGDKIYDLLERGAYSSSNAAISSNDCKI
jgi:hypothetical protein